MRCAVQNSTRPNPTNIANANPNPPTPAGRVVPVHSWRLVIVPCGPILCASLVRFCLNARSRVCALCGGEFKIIKALHGRLAGRFKPPLAGRCNGFAPSRHKNCHRQKQPSRPGPRKKKTPPRPVSSKKKKKPPRPASEKNNNRPVPPRKEKQTAPSRHEQQNTPPRGWKLETNTTACLFFSLSCCTFISYCFGLSRRFSRVRIVSLSAVVLAD